MTFRAAEGRDGAVLSRLARGFYKVERLTFFREGTFVYEPWTFTDLFQAICHAELWAGLLSYFDSDPRPKFINQPVYR